MKAVIQNFSIVMLMAVACSQLAFTDRASEFERIKDRSQDKVVILEAKLNQLSYDISLMSGAEKEAKKAEHRYLRRLLESFENNLSQVDEVDSELLYKLQERVPAELKAIEAKIDSAFVDMEA